MGILRSTAAAVMAAFFVTILVATSVTGAPIRSMLLTKMQRPSVFSQTGIKLHSAASDQLQAEMQEQLMQQLTAEIQQQLHTTLSEMIATELMKSEELDFKKNAKGIFDDLLQVALVKAKGVVAQSCEKLGNLAREKLRMVDEKLEEIANEGGPQAPSSLQLSQSAADRVLTDIQQQMRSEKWWENFKNTAKRAFKSVATHVKGLVKGFADAAKPLLAKAASDLMPKVQDKVDKLLGNACEYVQGRLKKEKTVLDEDGE